MSSGKNNNLKRAGVPSSEMWKGKHRNISSNGIFIMIAAAVVILVVVFFLQNSGLLHKDSSAEAQELNTIHINEIMADNQTAVLSENGEPLDWIEITNDGTETVDISRYALFLGSNINKIYTFPSMKLAPGEFTVVFADGEMATGNAPFKLPSSGGDTLVLLNAAGSVIESVTLPEMAADTAYCRDENGEWQLTKTATPGAKNQIQTESEAEAASVDAQVDVYPDAFEITEVMTSNTLYAADAEGKYCDYVEVHNISGSRADLSGWYLSDSASDLKAWAFPSVMLEPDARILVYCDGTDKTDSVSDLHADFRLASEGEKIYLTRSDGKCASYVSVPVLEDNQAYSYADGVWTTQIGPTPGLENTVDAAMQIASSLRTGNDVEISEIMASPSDEPQDWIELYNPTGSAVDLSGYYISDNAAKPRKYRLPSGTTIGTGEYKCVCLSGQEDETLGGYTNLPFKLSADGGYTMSLSKSDGTMIDAVYVPQQFEGISYGRKNGSDAWYYFENGTLGTSNSGSGYKGKVSVAKCSQSGGLYKTGDTVTVELTAMPGSSIYYTLDSSEPDSSKNLYTGPITISSTTILRSRVYADGYLPSYIDTHSYLYDVQTQDGVYIISLVSDMDNLTSDENGIMVAGSGSTPNYLQNWEREASIEFFTADGERVFGSECGIALHGMDSRELRVKSFNVIARGKYGNSRFNYPFFSERDYTSYKSLLLRPSGEDYNRAFMRDTLLSSLMKDSSLLYQKWELAVCYLDGQYYTIYYLRERLTVDAICQFEGWEGLEDYVDVGIGNDGTKHGSTKTYSALLDYVKQNDTTDDNVFATVEDQIDIQNYIEYMAIEIFSGNSDLQNVKRYRCSKADGKWRWALYDLDWAFNNDTNSIANWLNPKGTGASQATDTTLFIACMKNAGFRDRFLTYFGDMMATTFSTENVMSKIEERRALLADLLPAYTEKWGIELKGMNKFINYAKERPAKLLKSYFPEALNMSDADIQKYFGAALAKIDETDSAS